MPYDRLIKRRRISDYKATPLEIQRLLNVAVRDIETAKKNIENSPDWAYTMAYNAILQASRALMLSEGFRPRGGEQHATVIEFIRERLGLPYEKQVQLFDQMRRKRHRVIYEVSGMISKNEATQSVEFAVTFVDILEKEISNR